MTDDDGLLILDSFVILGIITRPHQSNSKNTMAATGLNIQCRLSYSAAFLTCTKHIKSLVGRLNFYFNPSINIHISLGIFPQYPSC
ncbi:unnamed protein product [Schistosoma mattheei]|uniref:Uncharacterized protein n=1 Tax=Schistosoma mattheei TaxID=31246 RepID=A0A183PLR2_9TREM|nr:unnamed protein product [Schistosoma mattheei]